jgi:hypothetical protein
MAIVLSLLEILMDMNLTDYVYPTEAEFDNLQRMLDPVSPIDLGMESVSDAWLKSSVRLRCDFAA